MLKSEEMNSPDSCFNRAALNERMFILLSRDIAAPDTIRFWVQQRLLLGKNDKSDAKIVEALDCAEKMEKEFYARTNKGRIQAI